jgi:hypothetical protein
VSNAFSLQSAAALLPDVREHAAEFVQLRADLATLTTALRDAEPTPLGGVADKKALEARMYEHLTWFAEQGLEVKGWAPLTLDFPAVIDGQPMLLCWLENEDRIGWWHSAEHGFAGRRPLGAV